MPEPRVRLRRYGSVAMLATVEAVNIAVAAIG